MLADTISTLKDYPDRLHNTQETAKLLGKSVAWAERQRWAGGGPKYLKIGRTPYYTGADLIAFINDNSK